MMNAINFNGKLIAAGQEVTVVPNRAFRYGDGLFESVRVFDDGKMPMLGRHWQRLKSGMEVLKFDIPPHFSAGFFEEEINRLTHGSGCLRVRLSVFRTGGGLYAPETNIPSFLIEADILSSPAFTLNKKGLSIGIFEEVPVPAFPASRLQPWNFKTLNALPFVLAAIYRQEKGWDDCLLLNTANRVACGNSSNLFLIKDGGLITPPLSEGCVAGTMRNMVKDIAMQEGLEYLEAPVSNLDLAAADEIMLTNAIQGIRWVQHVENVPVVYGKKMIETVFQKLVRQLNESSR